MSLMPSRVWPRRGVGLITALLFALALVALTFAQDGGTAAEGDAYHRIAVKDVATTRHTHACVVGTVTYRRKEADGDWHLKVEDAGAFLVAEIIPQIPLAAPKKGTRVDVCGITRFDKAHGWPELHPVTAITVR